MMQSETRVSYVRPVVSALVAATMLLVGYVDLWRGGASLSAIFLAVGYLIFVPIAVMAVPHAKKVRN
ncbi:MAG: hypothetical protein ABJC26_05710 [Gemmatimonadaceae bacterium]